MQSTARKIKFSWFTPLFAQLTCCSLLFKAQFILPRASVLQRRYKTIRCFSQQDKKNFAFNVVSFFSEI